MKKYLILFIFSFIVFSCGKKEVKKETTQDKNLIVKDSIKETVNEIEIVPELIFTVQIAALKNKNSRLSNLENIQVFQEGNLTKYRLGEFTTYKEARESRTSLILKYPGAFVQALKNGKPIHITKAF